MDVAGVKYMHLMTAYELGNGCKEPSHNRLDYSKSPTYQSTGEVRWILGAYYNQ
jgi:hypothetical protein